MDFNPSPSPNPEHSFSLPAEMQHPAPLFKLIGNPGFEMLAVASWVLRERPTSTVSATPVLVRDGNFFRPGNRNHYFYGINLTLQMSL
jgi:hypothetical protein